MRSLAVCNTDLLERMDDLLHQLNDEELRVPRAILFGSSIGGHFRHILEFYTGLLAREEDDRFSYDRRRRDPLLEQSVIAARACAQRVIGLLSEQCSDRGLRMVSELPGDAAPTEQQTTLARELAYLVDHGVHHLAMLRIALQQELPHVQFPEHMGVAAATRNHQVRVATR